MPSLAKLLVTSGVSYRLESLTLTSFAITDKACVTLGTAMQQSSFPCIRKFLFNTPSSYTVMSKTFMKTIQVESGGLEALLLGLVCCPRLEELNLAGLVFNFDPTPSRNIVITKAIWTGTLIALLPNLLKVVLSGPFLEQMLLEHGGRILGSATRLRSLSLELNTDDLSRALCSLRAAMAPMTSLRRVRVIVTHVEEAGRIITRPILV